SAENQTKLGPCGGSTCNSESAPEAIRVTQAAPARIPPAAAMRQIRSISAPTATALAMYQKTSSLLLSQSHGWNFTRLATRNTRLNGAISARARRFSASGLSSASRSSGQNRPVFLIQNQAGKSDPDIHPINHRGYWCSGGRP